VKGRFDATLVDVRFGNAILQEAYTRTVSRVDQKIVSSWTRRASTNPWTVSDSMAVSLALKSGAHVDMSYAGRFLAPGSSGLSSLVQAVIRDVKSGTRPMVPKAVDTALKDQGFLEQITTGPILTQLLDALLK
jgi:hypothetical protein